MKDIDIRKDWKTAVDEMDSILKKVDSENRDMTADEETRLKDLLKKSDELKAKINSSENLGQYQATVSSLVKEANTVRKHIDFNQDGERKADGKVSYRSTFNKDRETNGFTSFGEFLTLVGNNSSDPRLEKRTWAEVGGANGGFAVPLGFYEGIYNTVLETAVVPSRAMPFSLEYGNITIPAFDDLDRETDGLYGGMIPQWLGEAQTATPVTGKLREVNLKAKKLALYTNMSIEVAADSPSLEKAVTQKLAESISFYTDYYLLRGNGTAQPKGVLNDSALIKVARNGAGAVVWSDIVNMYGRLYQPSLKKAVWVISPSVVPQLVNMVDAGNHLIYVGNPSYTGTVAAAVPNSLLGLPVLVSEKLSSLGTEGDVLLADFSNYAYGTSPTILMERSNAPYWNEGLISYRAIVRLDACGLWSRALSPLNGDSDVSWCVCLQ